MTGIAARARGYRNTRSFRTTVCAVLLTMGVTGAGLALAQMIPKLIEFLNRAA